MIIKGTSRAGPSALATHLMNAETNERVQVIETRGTIARDLRGALLEMDAIAGGTRCEKPLYHAAISPQPPHILTPMERAEAIDALEQKLGLEGHARVVVIHEKHDRQHIHVVWSRIDLGRMRSVSDSHNYRKHEEVARDLERRFGHDRVQGAHHERDGVERPDRTPSRPELRQEERTGIKGKDVKAEVSALYHQSDGARSFQTALDEAGYVLAKGDRRDFVVVDRAGGVHSLARRIDGVNAADLREFMSPLDRDSFPTVEEAQTIQLDRELSLTAREIVYEENKLAAAFSRSEDYVTQSRAAQREHERRQAALDEQHAERLAREEERRQEDEQRRSAVEAERLTTPSRSTEAASDTLADRKITDSMAERLGEANDGSLDRGRSDEPPDRQREAPGGGHSRSR